MPDKKREEMALILGELQTLNRIMNAMASDIRAIREAAAGRSSASAPRGVDDPDKKLIGRPGTRRGHDKDRVRRPTS